MQIPRLARALAVLILAALAPAFGGREVAAQGVTTGAIAGTITDSVGTPLGEVQIRIRNVSTGVISAGSSRASGAYLVQGLEVGGPYEVIARRIGFSPSTKDGILVKLSQVTRVDFRLTQTATQLQAITVVATTGAETFHPTNQGTKAIVSDTTLQRIPSINRNLVDFIRIAPQVSQSGPGYSAGGMSNRMNNVQIDGSTERDVFGLGSTGQPGAQANARSVPIESVKELQVVLAPFDVRQGNFGGLLLNAVTKGGTNDLRGSLYYYYRNEKFGADTNILRATPFERKNWGFALGGPIIKDKLHFYVNPEFEDENAPVTGPYFGQPSNAPVPFAITDADRARFEQIMATRGLTAAELGTAGYVNIPNPVDNFFGRLDWRLNDTHRLVFRYNYGTAERLRQQNGRGQSTVVYSSNFHDFSSVKRAPVLQLYSSFANGTFNELFIAYNNVKDRRPAAVIYPQLTVTSVPRTGGGLASIIAGADQFSMGNELDQETLELTNNFTKPIGDHTLTFGTRNEYVKIRNLFTQSSFGVWSFRGIDSLAAGNPNSFRRAFILRDGGNVYFDALQSAWYAQDQWRFSDRLNLTLGVRFDVSRFLNDVAYSAAIDSAYGRRTDEIPKTSVQFSPRIGFNWDLTGDQVNQLRGGVGLFVGTPPYVWLENAYINNGEIITFLNCNTGGSRDPAPAFTANVDALPTTCRNGAGGRPIGAVNFLDKDLKFPQPMRLTLAYDRQLPLDLVGTLEGLYSKTLNQFFFVNRNLAGPRGTDRFGRVLYGDSIRTNGQAIPVLPASVQARGGASRFSEAIDIENQSKDYAFSITSQLRKRYSNNWEAQVAYTFSRARDVQSFTSSTHISNWRFGRTLSGRQEDKDLSISLFDQPHKISASATYTLQWLNRKLATDVSLFYAGVSGSPHDYVYSSSAGSADANADGATLNDLIYVPRNALDPNEIQFRQQVIVINPTRSDTFTVAAQQQAFENFIKNSECLSKYRGRILPRNACRLPFSNQVDFSLRQGVNFFGSNRLTITYDIFNVGNLINENWGKIRVSPASGNSNIPIITHVGQTSADPKTAVGIYQFNVRQQEYIDGLFVANFWRSQISVRYSF
ncbi:MAG: TonB-dependent receptor [Gemmatimonadaceae bacterium]